MLFSNKTKNVTELYATITRADGTVEELGVIATSKTSIIQKIKKFIMKGIGK
jgi:hypothetical protein